MFVLAISIILDEKGSIQRNHKKLKAISISAKTARVLFGPDEYVKLISILFIYDLYNYNINAVDKGDQLAANNTRLRPCKRSR